MVGLLQEALPGSTLVVAVDPGKVAHRVWLSTGGRGPVAEPRTLPVLRSGLDELERLVRSQQAPAVVFAVEASGALLHQAWVGELARRFPGSVRLFAPSQTTAAQAQSPTSGSTTPTSTRNVHHWHDQARLPGSFVPP